MSQNIEAFTIRQSALHPDAFPNFDEIDLSIAGQWDCVLSNVLKIYGSPGVLEAALQSFYEVLGELNETLEEEIVRKEADYYQDPERPDGVIYVLPRLGFRLQYQSGDDSIVLQITNGEEGIADQFPSCWLEPIVNRLNASVPIVSPRLLSELHHRVLMFHYDGRLSEAAFCARDLARSFERKSTEHSEEEEFDDYWGLEDGISHYQYEVSSWQETILNAAAWADVAKPGIYASPESLHALGTHEFALRIASEPLNVPFSTATDAQKAGIRSDLEQLLSDATFIVGYYTEKISKLGGET